MVNLDDPQSWVSLHWKQGILIQYFGSKAGKKELSFNVNSNGVKNLVNYCEKTNTKLSEYGKWKLK